MHASAGIRRIGWIGTVARVAPCSVGGGSNATAGSTRRLSQTSSKTGPCHSVNRLTLSASRGDLVEMVSDGAKREVLVQVLAHLERRLEAERDAA